MSVAIAEADTTPYAGFSNACLSSLTQTGNKSFEVTSTSVILINKIISKEA